MGANCWLCICPMDLCLHLRAAVASGVLRKRVNASWGHYFIKRRSGTENIRGSKTWSFDRIDRDQIWRLGGSAAVPVAPGRCFCRREDASWSSGEETPHTPLLMKQTGLQTCCCWTAAFGSENNFHPFDQNQKHSFASG